MNYVIHTLASPPHRAHLARILSPIVSRLSSGALPEFWEITRNVFGVRMMQDRSHVDVRGPLWYVNKREIICPSPHHTNKQT